MSMSLTGRHRDWLSLTPSSIRPNGSQARHGVKAEARQMLRWTGWKFSVGIGLLCSGMLDAVAGQEDIEARSNRHKAVHFLTCILLQTVSHLQLLFCQTNSQIMNLLKR